MTTDQNRAIDSAACEPRPPSCSCGDRHIPGVPHERWASPTCPTHGATRRAFIRRALEWHCDADVIDLLDAFEQAAGEAERTAQAVAREREACAALAFDLAGDGGSLATWRAIRARATSPAPSTVAETERAVVEAAVAWRASLDGPGECWHEARMREAVDVLAAARKGGG